jgi:hypothetical protein
MIEQQEIWISCISVQGTAIGLVLPAAIAGLWIFYMKRSIWKGTREGIAQDRTIICDTCIDFSCYSS